MEQINSHRFLDNYPVHHFQMENGLEVLLLHNPISPVAAYLTLYKVGSASEGPSQRGLAHFFEHMMFRETSTLGDGDFDRVMSEIGGVGLNAFTAYDVTAYHVNVPASHLERVIDLEADRMVNLRLSPEMIERERGAVLGEMKMYKDMPSEQMWEAMMAAAFTHHPYRHPIIGYLDQVAAFREQDFSTFYRQHYAPNRAMVVIAGGFEEGALLEKLERSYGGLPPGAPQPAPPPPEPPWERMERLELRHDKITTESLTLAFRSPGVNHPDLPALIMLSALLASGQSSPLHRRLILDGLAIHVSVSHLETEMMLSSPGLLLMDVSMRHGVPVEKAEEVIDEVLGSIRDDLFEEAELERARNQIKLSFFSGMGTNMSLARQVGGYAVACGDPLFSEKLLQGVGRVTRGEIRDVLESYMIEPVRLVAAQRPGATGATP